MKPVRSFFLLVLIFSAAGATAQIKKGNYHVSRRAPEFYVGPLFRAGTHAFALRSDIERLQGLHVTQTGTNIGGMIGHRVMRLTISKGTYRPERYVREKVTTRSTEGMIQVMPLQLMRKKFRSFEPYLVLGMRNAKYGMFGDFASPPPAPGQPCPCTCPCCLPEPQDPDLLTEEHVLEDADLGHIAVREFFSGFGAESHIQGKAAFVHLFAEFNYAFARHTGTTNPAFTNTSVVSPVEIRLGVAVGISK